ncbi:MAG: type II toxin-antitoxin system RelE/ParE family toxin [Candidatus Humimicrobiaceae bacterium]
MKLFFSERFKKDYKLFSDDIKQLINSKLIIFAENPLHPSLRTKKIKGKEDIFETSINMYIRMTWNYYEGIILLRAIGEHDKTLKNP